MEVPDTENSSSIATFKRIQDFVFCVFDKLKIISSVKVCLRTCSRWKLNSTVCAIEQRWALMQKLMTP